MFKTLVFLLFFLNISQSPRTTKDRQLVMFDGFEYRMKGQSRDGLTQFWACPRKDCPGRAHSPFGDNEHLQVVTPHSHMRVETDHTVRLAKEQIKETAVANPLENPREIVTHARQGLSDEQLMRMPDFHSSQRQVELSRVIPGAKDIDANQVANIVIGGNFVNDENGDLFLLQDSRTVDNDATVFFIFATQRGIQRLRAFRHWSGDGTFKVVPNTFLQLYTINVLIEKSSVPSAFILMENKAQNTYERVFEVIRDNVGAAYPLSMLIDFEQGAKAAFEEIWPQTQIRLCLFHLGQSVLRRVKRDGFIAIYEQIENFRTYVRSLTALAFIPPDRVQEYYEILRDNAPINTHQIFNYFQRTYIIRDNGLPALFPPNTWNHYDSVINDLCRTNNAQEGYHLALRRRFQNLHPRLSRFINVIKDEERHMQDKIHNYELDPTRGLNVRPRSKKYINNDLAIKQLVVTFDQNANPTEEQIIHHLRALQYRLARNEFDHWDD